MTSSEKSGNLFGTMRLGRVEFLRQLLVPEGGLDLVAVEIAQEAAIVGFAIVCRARPAYRLPLAPAAIAVL